ncbi:copper amine oxidase N-terminal domain-containing protein [Paenibacillus elgii]|uniref:copper amine oxidase N-terminal domain-containing protein n=1 Tax=Paenibacillus elgii TaxID=189691 RepID=UPI000FDCB325|nr:copper amine oxidase N-terminal domain-containing protein [Paenibacillus elgii]NEN83775.1 copper amine oxidase N-terminal domain-containing protein [Paenibacillus elgii]
MMRLKGKLALLGLCLVLLIPCTAGAQAGSAREAAAELRVRMDALLGEHALLAVFAMQKRYDGAADHEQAAVLLGKNTERLAATLRSTYGEEAAKTFEPLWSSYVEALLNYAQAAAAGEETTRTQAANGLEAYDKELALFWARLLPDLGAAGLEEGTKRHTDLMLQAFDAYTDKNDAAAYKAMREAYAHAVASADLLAAGMAAQSPDRFDASGMKTRKADLRSALGRLLGEHALTAAFAMQKSIDGASDFDFDQAATALNENAVDLAAAIASVYGETAGTSFHTAWTSRTRYILDYAKAAASKDESARTIAAGNLEKAQAELAQFFTDANPQHGSKPELLNGLSTQIGQMTMALDHSALGEYAAAYERTETAYAQMSPLADLLAQEISDQYPDRFPDAPASVQKTVTMQIGVKELTVNGQTIRMDVSPALREGVVYIPLRVVAEAAGATVTWDAATSTTRLAWGGNQASFPVGSDQAEVNGRKKSAGGAPTVMQDGRVMVPIDILGEATGWKAELGKDDGSIRLTTTVEERF